MKMHIENSGLLRQALFQELCPFRWARATSFQRHAAHAVENNAIWLMPGLDIEGITVVCI